jgi:hypothetical protein
MVKRPSKSKPLGGHRYWKFEPDPILTGLKHHTPNKISAMQRGLLNAMPEEGLEISHEDRGSIHPILRDRLPAGSRREDFERVAESLEYARRLSDAGLTGAQFYPSVVDTSMYSKWHRTGDIYSFRTFLDVPGEESHLIMPTTYVMPKGPGHYFIEAYGMQRADDRETIHRGLRRTFDVGAPMLGLSLTSNLLRRNGARRIALPGNVLQWNRKGTKRPQSYKELKGYANSIHQLPETREALKEIIENWEHLSGIDVRKRLLDIRKQTGQHFLDAYGAPKVLLERNYLHLPERFGATPITAQEALGPTAQMPVSTYWGHPDPASLMKLRAYDINLEKVDALSPFLSPMTKKEVSDWKEKMRTRGHDTDHITSIP